MIRRVAPQFTQEKSGDTGTCAYPTGAAFLPAASPGPSSERSRPAPQAGASQAPAALMPACEPSLNVPGVQFRSLYAGSAGDGCYRLREMVAWGVGKKAHIKTVGKFALSAFIIALFCFMPALLLYQNIGYSAGAQKLSNSATLGSPTDDYYGSATPIYSSATNDVCVAFEFLGLDPASSYARFGIVIGATQNGSGYVRSQAKKGYTRPLLLISSNIGLSSIVIPVPLSTLQRYDSSPACNSMKAVPYVRGSGFRMLQSVFVLGQPRAFPDDWYELNDRVTVYLCRTKQTRGECVTGLNQNGTASAPGRTLPASLIATTDDQDLMMNVSTRSQSQLQFVIQRWGLFVAYTYVIAVMPFIFIILLFSTYILRKRAKAAGKETSYSPAATAPAVYEIAFGVAAALVAILPLRAVLVPSSLPNLTRLDIVFSTGAALLVALSVVWVFVWKQQEVAESPAQQSNPAGNC
ncbi:MAG TPA: hypothetical protein VLW44_01620 [Streptosporangiaceae bacterium]|nr:hypothetical protein [Streptosporangiaceae bacterium]